MLDPDTRYPVAEVLPNFEMDVPPVDEGETVDFALLILQVGESGDDAADWSYRTTESPNREELLGALEMLIDRLKQSSAAFE